jgi:hypothetical protein
MVHSEEKWGFISGEGEDVQSRSGSVYCFTATPAAVSLGTRPPFLCRFYKRKRKER